MKIDLYTKSILTVIAASLSSIALRAAISPAHAQNYSPTHVIVDQIGLNQPIGYGPMPVEIESVEGAVPVRVQP